MGFAPAQFLKGLFVFQENEFPWIDGPGRRGAYQGFLQYLNLVVLNGAVLEHANAPPVSQDIDHLRQRHLVNVLSDS